MILDPFLSMRSSNFLSGASGNIRSFAHYFIFRFSIHYNYNIRIRHFNLFPMENHF